MKVIKSVSLFSLFFILISCATTKVPEEIEEEVQIVEEVIEVVEPTPEELFIQSLANIKIEVVQSPKTANYNKDFSSTFKAFVSDLENNPVAGFNVTVTYPAERINSEVKYETAVLTTDENGFVEFKSNPLAFGVDDFVTFYPTPAFDDSAVAEACENLSAKAKIKSKSDLTRKGAILFVWDYSENGKPVNNSYELMAEIRSYGITMVGNAPVNDTSDIGTPLAKLYKRNYEIVENAYGYLICGTIKYSQPVTKIDDGYECELLADISVVRMKDGNVVLEKSYTNKSTGKNWSACTTNCKEQIAAIICNDLIYGL